MENSNKQQQKCTRLIYQVAGYGEPTVIYGLILEEDSEFIIFKTAKKEYKISKKLILMTEETTKNFRFDNEAAP